MALPVFRYANVAGGAASTTSVSVVLSILAGDLLLAVLQWQDAVGATPLTPPSGGWQLVARADGGTSEHLALYALRATAAAAGATFTFDRAVARPYLALAAYQTQGAGFEIRALDIQADVRQLAAPAGRYGAVHAEPQYADGAVVYAMGFQYGSTVTYQAAPAQTPNLRATQDQFRLFDGSGVGGTVFDPCVTIAETGLRVWDALAVEIRALPPGQRPAGGTFVPDRVYEDLARRVWSKGLGVPANRS